MYPWIIALILQNPRNIVKMMYEKTHSPNAHSTSRAKQSGQAVMAITRFSPAYHFLRYKASHCALISFKGIVVVLVLSFI